MRIFAISDLHVDYEVNARWLEGISKADYQQDVLILAGDVTDVPRLLGWCLSLLAGRFRQVLFVPGNHELWVARQAGRQTSLDKFAEVAAVAGSSGARLQPFEAEGIRIVPLLGWYDYSFGEPGPNLRSIWMDFHACRWPRGVADPDIAAHFAAANEPHLVASRAAPRVISFSHFLPRIDLMPQQTAAKYRDLYPILGTTRLEAQLRRLGAQIHVYGHSHLNQQRDLDGVSYINNAFGYPDEGRISRKRLLCVYE